jgi:hypothetical protein
LRMPDITNKWEYNIEKEHRKICHKHMRLDLSDSVYGQVVQSMKTVMQQGTNFPKI